uniref:Uncharacterized protein n=1 Tax=Romanomermis culicivorax TaxID=13658 RepID=A0A915HG83_ROMCU
MSYKECLSFIRDERVLAHFRDICVRNGHISKSDYNFALYFISAMVLLRKKYAEQKNVEDNSGFTFVNRKFEALDHHISDRIIDTIRTYNVQNGTNFPLVGAYQVRRASVTSAVMKVTKDFEEAIAEGEIDIGQ